MSKSNNLTDFLADVANAIRTRKGTTAKINPQNFSQEIAKLAAPVFESLAEGDAFDIDIRFDKNYIIFAMQQNNYNDGTMVSFDVELYDESYQSLDSLRVSGGAGFNQYNFFCAYIMAEGSMLYYYSGSGTDLLEYAEGVARIGISHKTSSSGTVELIWVEI